MPLKEYEPGAAFPGGDRPGTGVLLGVHAICEIASEVTGTGQVMIHNQSDHRGSGPDGI
jgi:hypothetical protein